MTQALAEDLGSGDITTSAVVESAQRSKGSVRIETECVVVGLPVARAVFETIDLALNVSTAVSDGEKVQPGHTVLTVIGDGRSILAAERVALNFLQRLSGIATLTAQFCEAVRGYRVRIAATRKTTPGLRHLEKWAVAMGGGVAHRETLSHGILIKDNHLALLGGDVARACRLARERAPFGVRIGVEVTSLEQVQAALDGGAEMILLDNMQSVEVRSAVELVKGRALVEVSGGVTLENVLEFAAVGADILSIGALTQSAPAVQMSMDLSRHGGG